MSTDSRGKKNYKKKKKQSSGQQLRFMIYVKMEKLFYRNTYNK